MVEWSSQGSLMEYRPVWISRDPWRTYSSHHRDGLRTTTHYWLPWLRCLALCHATSSGLYSLSVSFCSWICIPVFRGEPPPLPLLVPACSTPSFENFTFLQDLINSVTMVSWTDWFNLWQVETLLCVVDQLKLIFTSAMTTKLQCRMGPSFFCYFQQPNKELAS